jgi:endoglucanase
MDIYKTLQDLAQVPGPSGMEAGIADAIEQVWTPLVDEISRDYVGNLIACKRAEVTGDNERRPRLLIAAHMDEIALMVKQVVRHPDVDDGYGFLRVTSVGGVDRRHLYGQLVTVHGREELSGIIGALPAHMLPSERSNKVYDYDELVVDVGLPAAELKNVVDVGDFVTFRQPLRRLLNERAAGKALDNRASVAAVTRTLEYLSTRRHTWDVIAVATAQEETRLLGALTSAYTQQPDVAIAVDVTFAKGPGARESYLFELGDGPTLGLGPNVHPGVFAALQDAAKALEMTVHTDPHWRGSGTDAFGLQIARAGVPTGLVSIPLRYMHTMVETISLDDIERAGWLIGEFAARLEPNFVEQITAQMMKS